MKQSNIDLLVGLFVVAGLAAIVWFAIEAGAGVALGGSTYKVKARFTNIGGLKTGSQVFVAGVPVGRVERIDLDAGYAAIVHMIVRHDLHLPVDTIASIRTSGLIGDKFVSLAPGADSANLTPDGTIIDTESAVDLESLISKFAFGSVSSSATPSPSPSPSK